MIPLLHMQLLFMLNSSMEAFCCLKLLGVMKSTKIYCTKNLKHEINANNKGAT